MLAVRQTAVTIVGNERGEREEKRRKMRSEYGRVRVSGIQDS